MSEDQPSIPPEESRDSEFHHHAVQFYETEEYLCDAVCRFVSSGFRNNNPVVMIATPEHHRAFTARLQAEGFNINEGADAGFVQVDARDTLAKFMNGDLPDRDRFCETFTAIFKGSCGARGNSKVIVYGEM